MKILVIRFTSMGDVVIAASLFSYLKKIHPDSYIHFLTDANYSDLFKNDPRLNAVTGIKKNSEQDFFLKTSDILWDAVIDLQHNKRSLRIKKKISHAIKIGVFKKQYPRRLFLLLARINLYNADDSVARRYIKASGMNETSFVPPSPRIFINDQDSQHCYKKVFNGSVIRPLIALVPFSAWKNKEWGHDSYCSVGRYFIAKGWDVAIFGGPEDQKAAIAMQMRIGRRCKALAGQLSLYECACVLKQASLAVGNDTGLSHLARACGVKTGIIFGSTTFHFGFFPFGRPSYKVFEAKHFCRPCHPHGGNICFLKNRRCLRSVMPEIVIKGLEELYQER